MDKQSLKQLIDGCHAQGRPVALSFCSHVPTEILEAAGFANVRILHVDGMSEPDVPELPKNLCPIVRQCCALCLDEAAKDADLIFAESSCDGKKKMYELLPRQEQLHYYQVPQGADRSYVNRLIRSECQHLIRMLEARFGVTVTDDALRAAAGEVNAWREAAMELMALQKQQPPALWGRELLAALDAASNQPTARQRREAVLAEKEALLAKQTPVPGNAPRILVTGCPISGICQKVVGAIEDNGGVVVAFETCEGIKAHRRHVDTSAEDILGAIASCYQQTACAIMSPNFLRFQLLEELIAEYHVDGIVDVTLQACHPYTVERDKMRSFCTNQEIPYLPVETDFAQAGSGQLETRMAAFVEML